MVGTRQRITASVKQKSCVSHVACSAMMPAAVSCIQSICLLWPFVQAMLFPNRLWALCAGATLPMFSIIFGDVIDALGGSPTTAELVHQVNKVSMA